MMNIILSASLIPSALIVYFCCYFIPIKTEKTLFGVNANKELRESDAGKKAVKDFKKEMWIIFVISLLTVGPVFLFEGDGIPFAYWMMWFFAICIGYNVPFAVQNSRLKLVKGELNKNKEESTFTYHELKIVRKLKIYHFIPQIAVTTLLSLPLFIGKLWETDDSYFEVYLVNYISFAVTLAILIAVALLMDRMKVAVISEDSTLNQNYARAKKKVWKSAWVALSWELVAPVAALAALVFLPKGFNLFIILVTVISFVMLLTAIVAFFKINKIDKAYHDSIDDKVSADDDKYWIFGMFYFNPKDPSYMVEKRYGMGTTINMASKGGKATVVFTILILLSVPLLSVYLILLEITPFHMNISDEKVVIYQLREEYSIDLDDVTDVTLLEECPDASKVRGTGMKNLQNGTWRTEEYGKVEMFLNPQNDKFLLIEAGDGKYIFSGYDDEETMEVYDYVKE